MNRVGTRNLITDVPGILVGSLAGSFVADVISGDWLYAAFVVFLYLVCAKMLIGQVGGRRKRGSVFKWIFLMALLVAVMALLTLLITIINQSFGYVALQNTVDPEEIVVGKELPGGCARPCHLLSPPALAPRPRGR